MKEQKPQTQNENETVNGVCFCLSCLRHLKLRAFICAVRSMKRKQTMRRNKKIMMMSSLSDHGKLLFEQLVIPN